MEMQQVPRQQRSAAQRVAFRVAQRLWWVVARSEFYILEALVGLGAAGWGLWLANPYWHSFASSPSYEAMAHYAPEEVWGLALLALGLAQVGAAGAQLLLARRILSLLAVFVWLFVSVMFVSANVASTASVMYPVLEALPNVIIFLRLSGEVGRGRHA